MFSSSSTQLVNKIVLLLLICVLFRNYNVSGNEENESPLPVTFMYMLPKILKIGDGIVISATLRDNAKMFQINLLNRGFAEIQIDYGNLPLEMTFEIGKGKDNVTIAQYWGSIKTQVSQEIGSRKHIMSSNLNMILSISRESESEQKFKIDVFVDEDDRLLNTVEYENSLGYVGYLQFYGDVEKVKSLNFMMV